MFTLPTDPSPPIAKNPQVLCLYGPAKIGKDTAAALWNPDIHLDCEPGGGTAYLTTRRVICPDLATLLGDPFAGENEKDPTERTRIKAESRRESIIYAAKAAYKAHKASGATRPYRIVLSSIGIVEEWCEEWALQLHKRSLQGKSWDDSHIYWLPQGLGYHLTRERMNHLWNELITSCDELMVLAHPRTSVAEKGESFTSSADLDLVGKMRALISRRCTAIGFLQRVNRGTGSVLKVTFACKSNEQTIVGTRLDRLDGKEFDLVYVTPDGFFAHGWEHIYLPPDRPPRWIKSTLRKDQQPAPEVPSEEVKA